MYTKYSASGNDFVLFHTFQKHDRSKLAIELCDRHDGIGADGLVVLLPHEDYDFEWQFYNSDGSVASMCGNASRAAAHYSYTNGLSINNTISFLTGAGAIVGEVEGDIVETRLTEHTIHNTNIQEYGLTWALIDTGVPHLVALVDDLKRFDVSMARALRHQYNANVNMVMVVDGKLYVRTYERGVEDETLACGTGMVASFVLASLHKLVNESAPVYPKSNEELTVRIKDERLYFKGAVKKVFVTL